MGEDRKIFKIKDGNLGEVKIADEVVAIIAGLAATEVDGVGSMAGNITNELVSRLGMKNLSKGIRVEVLEGIVNVDVALNISYGYSIPEVSAKVHTAGNGAQVLAVSVPCRYLHTPSCVAHRSDADNTLALLRALNGAFGG